MNNIEREFDWNDDIKQDSEFILLPEGDYKFTVDSFERARHNPGEGSKLPPCNKAIIKIKIVANEGETTLTHNLFLHSRTEGMLSAFFGAIGLKKKGDSLKMDWNNIIGRIGVCKVGTREYNGNKYNDVKRMIYAEDVDNTKVLNNSVAQNYQQEFIPLSNNMASPFEQQPSWN